MVPTKVQMFATVAYLGAARSELPHCLIALIHDALAYVPSSVPPPACALPYEAKDSDVLLGVTLHELHQQAV